MKKIPVVAIVFCLFLTSCNSRFTAGVDKECRYFDKYELADIKNISEIKDLLDDSERYGLYSELEDNKDILYWTMTNTSKYKSVLQITSCSTIR